MCKSSTYHLAVGRWGQRASGGRQRGPGTPGRGRKLPKIYPNLPRTDVPGGRPLLPLTGGRRECPQIPTGLVGGLLHQQHPRFSSPNPVSAASRWGGTRIESGRVTRGQKSPSPRTRSGPAPGAPGGLGGLPCPLEAVTIVPTSPAQKSESASSSSASTRLVREWMGAKPGRRPQVLAPPPLGRVWGGQRGPPL